MKISEVDNTLILIDIIHGHAISRKKRRHIRHLLATVQPRIFAPHFFTIENFSFLEKLIFIGREDFVYFENNVKNQ